MNFAEAAVTIRQHTELSQRAMAKLLGITAVHLCNIERGHSLPSLNLCQRYEETTGYDLYVAAWRMMHGKDGGE